MGHCKSSNTTIATCAPLGGRSTESTLSCAEAQTAPASAITETRDKITRRWTSIFFISVWVLCFGLACEKAINILDAGTLIWASCVSASHQRKFRLYGNRERF